jgi:uncharacterized membrane protein
MNKNRLEAFSDGVIAIIITIMVLELKTPTGHALADLNPVLPVLISYVLSFVYVAIYWNNHHHLMQVVKHVDGATLWANMHLLFWLSLVPFITSWVGESHFATTPVAIYGVLLLLAGLAYYILCRVLLKRHAADSPLALAIGNDRKGMLSILLYAVAVAIAFWQPYVACAIYVLVAIIWLVPDRRIERIVKG